MYNNTNNLSLNDIKQSIEDSENKLGILNFLNSLKNLNNNELNENFIDKVDNTILEFIGLTTENSSLRDKIVEYSTKKAITEYLLEYLKDIESNIINNAKTKLRLHQKIKKLINDYIKTNYFKKIIIVTVSDGLIDTIFGDDYSLSQYIYNLMINKSVEESKLTDFFSEYKDAIDGSNLTDLKISFRKVFIDKKPNDDIFCDIWLRLLEISDYDICNNIFNSFNDYKFKKQELSEKYISPIINTQDRIPIYNLSNFSVVSINNENYYVSSIKTFEDNDTKFEKFISKLKSNNKKLEADILHVYIGSNIDLLTEDIINEKFSQLPKDLFEELVEINKHKYKQTVIGHIILSDPTINIYENNHNLNFIVKMVMDSIYKMTEILLINDYEFQQFQKEMLITLQQISQLRDIETAQHQDRVTLFTKILAEAVLDKKESNELDKIIVKNNLNLDSDYFIIDKEYIRDLVYSASLHDLGKVGIDDSILKNPNKLNSDEFEAMKKHTIYGNQRLSSIVKISRKKSFLILAAGLAENHHERWDGSGYPNGKKALEIPLSARILSIADVYDALRMKRPYKKSLNHKEAINYIIQNKGKHFDPVLTDIFVEYEKFIESSFINNYIKF